MVKFSKKDVDDLQNRIEFERDAIPVLLTHSMEKYVATLNVGCTNCGCAKSKVANNISMQMTEITCPNCDITKLMVTIPVNLN